MNDNIISLVPGNKQGTDELPTNNYTVVDIDGEVYVADGFAVFTSQHVAIMQDFGDGSIPVLILPLARVKYVHLTPDEEESPF